MDSTVRHTAQNMGVKGVFWGTHEKRTECHRQHLADWTQVTTIRAPYPLPTQDEIRSQVDKPEKLSFINGSQVLSQGASNPSHRLVRGFFFFPGDLTIEKVTVEIKVSSPLEEPSICLQKEIHRPHSRDSNSLSRSICRGAHTALQGHPGVCQPTHDVLKPLLPATISLCLLNTLSLPTNHASSYKQLNKKINF